MAGTSPPPYHLIFLGIYFYTIVLCIHVSCASSFALNFSTTSMSPCNNDLVCWGNASFANHMIELTTNEISTGSGHSLGRVWYARPVRIWDAATGELASFTTTFSFKITLDQKNKNPGGSPNASDGMAFFLTPYSTNDVLNSSSEGGFLGLFNNRNKYNATGGNRVVAVEFDTFLNKWDNSGQHVGIDVNSIWSVASTDTSPVGDKINLTSNTMMAAKINYDNQTKLLAVDLDVDGASYHVNHTVNLKIFLPEEVAVGFSAATGSSAELHRISFWSFDSSLEEKVVPPASAPAQRIAYTSTPPVKSRPSIKYSAATGLSPELHRILVESPSFGSDGLGYFQPPPPGTYEETPYGTSTYTSSYTRSYIEVAPSPLLPKVLASVLVVWVFATVCVLVWLWLKRRKHVQQNEAPNDNESFATVRVLVWPWLKRRKNVQQNEAPNDNESSDEQHGTEADYEIAVAGPRRYHYRELAAATGDFSHENRLGRGGFGSVYRGNLHGVGGDKQVAVKLFASETSSQGRKQFEAEVKIISRLRHRNLVQLLGWCDSAKGLLLVYELVPEGSLDKHIHNNPRLLTWPERYKIIMGLGSALRYLHQEWDQCIVHGDIKPSNIMLDSSYNTKLGDFGLARLVDHGTGLQTTMHVAGTAGYIDPDFVSTCRPSTESDVYSFGIVLLEIVSGRQPVVLDPPFVLLKWVSSLHSQGAILDAADARLLGGDAADEGQMERALVVGLWCAHHDPEQRPSIVDAMDVLRSKEAKLPVLPPHLYKPLALPSVVSDSGVSGSSFSSGVRSSATTGTTNSSQSLNSYRSPVARFILDIV